MERPFTLRRSMQAYRVFPRASAADPEGLRRKVAADCGGDARARPLDCTGARYLVRDSFDVEFRRLVNRFGLRAENETRNR